MSGSSVAKFAALDARQKSHRADQVLVHRVVVIHVELHLGHDAAEIGNETAEHARLVHGAQAPLRIFPRRQDLEEQAVRLLVLAELLIDELERARDELQRIRMNVELVLHRDVEQTDEVDGVLLEDVRLRDIEPAPFRDEIAERAPAPEPREKAPQGAPVLLVLHLERGAKDAREVAHVLRHDEIVLHEALDVGEPAVTAVAQPFRHLALHVEREPFLGAAGEEVEVAAHGPQEAVRFLESAIFVGVEQAEPDELARVLHAIDVFRDPIERLQIP